MGAVKFRIIPNAAKTEFAGPYGDALKLKISSPPLDGKANAELVKFLSKKLKISKGAIRIISGETSRDKLVEIEGYDQSGLEKSLG
jgi:uncharacterized protein (TIGR00251 family)